jgi:hypothetical protein
MNGRVYGDGPHRRNPLGERLTAVQRSDCRPLTPARHRTTNTGHTKGDEKDERPPSAVRTHTRLHKGGFPPDQSPPGMSETAWRR